MTVFGDFLALTLTSLIPILAPAIGGMFAERARASNIALDGCMLVAALAAIAIGAATGSPWLGLLAGVVAGAVYSSILAFAAFVLRSDLLIAGIAANLLATGVTLLVVQNVLGSTGTYAPTGVQLIPRIPLGPLAEIPILGDMLDRQSALLYITVLLFAVGAVVMNRTRFGVHVKAVGESDEAALAVGIKPVAIRTATLLISGALAGVGGAYLSISSVASFNSNLTGGLGFIAFAAVIFGRATPLGTVLASLLFAAATALGIQIQGTGAVSPQLLHMLPYVATVVALAVQAIGRRRRERFDVSETNYVPAIIPRG
ncbi:ABC transporter permease [Herbiconiux sp. L3-i23]|uniref:ABC transporter permease n=1 Tax=Herbiconiux sp. L3-i23 TaxID=2905871 RepID=UPI00204B2192|nr:ABC transporter permease [Herbiconiux sp. L3-i23]BDI21990.1 ABC transporter permease [Herbiconiux sp. L3-i23]